MSGTKIWVWAVRPWSHLRSAVLSFCSAAFEALARWQSTSIPMIDCIVCLTGGVASASPASAGMSEESATGVLLVMVGMSTTAGAGNPLALVVFSGRRGRPPCHAWYESEKGKDNDGARSAHAAVSSSGRAGLLRTSTM